MAPDYFDLSALVERELERESYRDERIDNADLELREFDDWDEEYVEFDNEVFDL